jgi:prepilin-type N-terminal cleavage/methylation domain-containing protein
MTANGHPQSTLVDGPSQHEVFVPRSRAMAQHRSGVRQRQSESGFTLVELLVAMAVVGILSAVAIVGLAGLTKTGNKSQCSTLLGSAQSAAATYYASTGAYPKTTGAAPLGFDALMTATPPLPAALTLPSGVTAAGNVMNAGTNWSITIGGGGATTPNTFTKTSGGVACS